MSLIINAKVGRDVATADEAGAYLLANMKDQVMIKITGKNVDVICEVNNIYNSFVSSENRKRVLYLKLKKDIYMIVCSQQYGGMTPLRAV